MRIRISLQCRWYNGDQIQAIVKKKKNPSFFCKHHSSVVPLSQTITRENPATSPRPSGNSFWARAITMVGNWIYNLHCRVIRLTTLAQRSNSILYAWGNSSYIGCLGFILVMLNVCMTSIIIVCLRKCPLICCVTIFPRQIVRQEMLIWCRQGNWGLVGRETSIKHTESGPHLEMNALALHWLNYKFSHKVSGFAFVCLVSDTIFISSI